MIRGTHGSSDEDDEEVAIAPQRRLSDWLRSESPDGKGRDVSETRPQSGRKSPAADSPFMVHLKRNSDSNAAAAKRREEEEEALDQEPKATVTAEEETGGEQKHESKPKARPAVGMLRAVAASAGATRALVEYEAAELAVSINQVSVSDPALFKAAKETCLSTEQIVEIYLRKAAQPKIEDLRKAWSSGTPEEKYAAIKKCSPSKAARPMW